MRSSRRASSIVKKDSPQVPLPLHSILWALSLAVAGLGILQIVLMPADAFRMGMMIVSFGVISLVLRWLSKHGQPRWASLVLIVAIWSLVTAFAWTAGGIQSRAAWAYCVVVFLAGIWLGGWAGLVTAVICSLTTLGLVWAESRGVLPPSAVAPHPFDFWLINTLYLALVVGLQYLVSRFIQDLLKTSQRELQEREQAEATVRRANAYNRSLLEAGLDLLVALTPAGQISDLNSASERASGYRRGELLGADIRDYFLEHDAVAAGLQQVLAEGTVCNLEWSLRHSDGHVTLMLCNLTVYLNEAEQVAGVFLAARDITERKRAEGLIQAQNEQLQAQNEALVRQEQLLLQTEADLRQINAELEQRVVDRTRELTILYRLTATVNQAQSREQLLAQALPLALEAVRCVTGRIYLLAGTPPAPRLAWEENPGAPAKGEVETLVNGLVAEVLAQSKPVLRPIVRQPLPGSSNADSLTRGVYVGARLRAGEHVLGVLCVQNEHLEQMTLEVMSLLDAVGERIGLALENLQLLSENQQLAVLQERQRLARDLHDSVTQQVYSLLLFASRAKKGLRENDLAVSGQQIRRIEEVAQQTLKELRLLIFELRPLALDQVGLVAALQQRLESVEKRAGLTAHLRVEGEPGLSPQVEETLYHIGVEALNNSLKHAAASEIVVALSAHDGWVTLEVADNGRGFVLSALPGGGSGLENMRARAQALGAELDVQSTPGAGTTIRVKLEVRHG
jgi:PAS domain S-box-containing protein